MNTNEVLIQRDIVYANHYNYYTNEQEDLKLDIYTPQNATAHPLVVLAHGGGFRGGDKRVFLATATYLASQGYIVASMTYRLGWQENLTSGDCQGEKKDLVRAWYNAMQDMSTALNYLVNTYEVVDTQNIFIGGSSAGASIGMALAYYSQGVIDNRLPFLKQRYGAIPAIPIAVKGVIALWGGILSIGHITNPPPTLFLHGKLDEDIPYAIGKYKGCANYVRLYGAKKIAQQLNQLETATHVYIKNNAKHGHGYWTEQEKQYYILTFLEEVINNTLTSSVSIHN